MSAMSNEEAPAVRGGAGIGIGHRLWLGFGLICAILAVAVAISATRVAGVRSATERMAGLRVPVADAGSVLQAQLHASLAALRGWMLTADEAFQRERVAAWGEIDRVAGDLDRLSTRFPEPENVRKWQEARQLLGEFREAQDRIEAIANTTEAQPALHMLVSEAEPRAEAMIREIARMITDEDMQPASEERRPLVKALTGFQGTLGVNLGYVRAYLLTGDDRYSRRFYRQWEDTTNHLATLTEGRPLLTEFQQKALDTLEALFAEFDPMPAEMFDMRASERWNEATYLLVTEAVPRAEKIVAVLDGEKGEDGRRSGGLLDAQKQLLNADAAGIAGVVSSLQSTLWTLLAVGLLIGISVAFFVSRGITLPLAAMTAAMNRLAGGDTGIEVPARQRRDEVGLMARAVQVFKDNAIRMQAMQAERAEQERRAEQEKKEAIAALAGSFEVSVKGIVQIVSSSAGDLQNSAEALSAISERTMTRSTALASASEQASANVETVAAATEQLTASIGEIGQQVAHSAEISNAAAEEAGRVNHLVEELSEAVRRIGEVVSLISDIASQTNLLALNATIEAARAGDAGKGFAVVANEVKNLAAQTAKATDEIAGQINAVQGATTGAVGAIKGITGTITRLSEIAATIASAVEEQGAATQEIARNVSEAAHGTREVSVNVADVSQASQETGRSAGQLLEAARELAQQSTHLRTDVEAFIGHLRNS